MKIPNQRFVDFINLIKKFNKKLQFNIVEVGAHPYGTLTQSFHVLLDYFEGCKITAFEVDKHECKELNDKAKKGITYYPFALGSKNEKRNFYITKHPMCSSLLKPNKKINSLYNNLQFMELKETIEIETVILDEFIEKKKLGKIDFIKIDIQGAELEVFKGSIKTLKETLFINTEVEFLEMYENQPLFSDVSSFLKKNGFMLHKFLPLKWKNFITNGV